MAAAPAARSDLDLKKFARKLDQEHQRLTEELQRLAVQDETGGTSGELSELSDYDQHQADQATELFFREQDQAIAASLRQERDQVEAAQRRMETGAYGYCDRCGAEIPKDRLEVMPFALYCIQCASEVAA